MKPAKPASATMDEETFIPSTMRALYYDTTSLTKPPTGPGATALPIIFDPAFPTPRTSPTQYLIKVHAASFSHDELRLARDLNPTTTTPQIPLHNFCGIVIDTPVEDHWNAEGPAFKIGDPVFGLASYTRDGAAADYTIATQGELAPKPDSISVAEASTIPLPALTAWQALFVYGGLDPNATQTDTRPNDLRVLVTNAKGSEVGHHALQLLRAKSLFPTARPWVCAICSCPDHETYLRTEAGVDEVIIAPLPIEPEFDLGATFRDKQWGAVDVVIDCAGGETFRQAHSESVVKDNGVVLTAVDSNPGIGAAGGQKRGLFSRFVAVRPDGEALGRIARLVQGNEVRGRVESVVDLVNSGPLLDEGAAAAAGGRRGEMMVVRVNPVL